MEGPFCIPKVQPKYCCQQRQRNKLSTEHGVRGAGHVHLTQHISCRPLHRRGQKAVIEAAGSSSPADVAHARVRWGDTCTCASASVANGKQLPNQLRDAVQCPVVAGIAVRKCSEPQFAFQATQPSRPTFGSAGGLLPAPPGAIGYSTAAATSPGRCPWGSMAKARSRRAVNCSAVPLWRMRPVMALHRTFFFRDCSGL